MALKKNGTSGVSENNKVVASSAAKVGLGELTKKGEAVYQKSCQSCHQKDGAGMPPTFPALKGSTVVTGSIDKQVELMLKGKAMMPAFGKNVECRRFCCGISIYPKQFREFLR